MRRINDVMRRFHSSGGGGRVAAVAGVVNDWIGDADLAEGVIDIRIANCRRADISDFAGELVGTAETMPNVGRAESFEDDGVAFFCIFGQIVFQKKHRFARSTSVNRTGYFHWDSRSSIFFCQTIDFCQCFQTRR